MAERLPGAHVERDVALWRRLILLLAAPLCLIGPALLPGHRLPDTPGGGEAVVHELGRELARGALPTWSARSGLGMPFAAVDRTTVAYPPTWLGVLIEEDVRAAWVVLLTLAAGGVGTWLFLAGRGFSPGARAVGALAFQTAGWAARNVLDERLAGSAVWLPWMFYAADGIARRRSLAGPGLVAATGLSFLAGSPATAAVGAGAALLFRGIGALRASGRPSRVAAVAGFLVLGVGAGGAFLVPHVEARTQAVEGYVSLVLPHAEPGLSGPAFAGVAILLLAVTALVALPRRALAPGLVLVAVWGIALEWPALSSFSRELSPPAAFLALEWLLLPWLAALGAEALLDGARRAWPTLALSAFGVTAHAFLAGTTGAAGGQGVWEVPGGDAGRVLAAGGATLVAALTAVLLRRARGAFEPGAPRWKLVVSLAVLAALFAAPIAAERPGLLVQPLSLALLLTLSATVLRRRLDERTVVALPLVVVVALEGAYCAGEPLRPERAGDLRGTELTRSVEEAVGDGRLLCLDERGRPAPCSEVLPERQAEALARSRVADLVPHAAFPPRALVELHQDLARAAALLDHPLLDLARVTALVSRVPLEHERLEEVAVVDGLRAYARTGVPPAVHLTTRSIETPGPEAARGLLASGVLDPARDVALSVPPGRGPVGGPAVVRSRRPTAARIDVSIEAEEGEAGGWLVFHEQFAPGWKATVNGRDAEIVRANHALFAVHVPPGAAVVRTKYEPWSLRVGVAASIASLALALLLAYGSTRASRRVA